MNVHWPCKTWGNPASPALLMLHGFMGSGEDWRTVVQSLSENFFCIAPDLPGHGAHTQRDQIIELDLEHIGQALVSWLDGQPWRPAIGLGYSLGGRVLLQSALLSPRLFRALILEGVNPGIGDATAQQTRRRQDGSRAEQISERGLKAFVDDWYEQPLFQSLQRNQNTLNQLKSRRAQNDPMWMSKVLKELSPGRHPSLWPRLTKLNLPALVLAGTLDGKYLDLGQRLADALPNGRFQPISDAGHNAHLERPREFVAVVRRFLSSLGN